MRSMLIPASASAWKSVAATPLCVFMPTPTTDSFAICSWTATCPAADLGEDGLEGLDGRGVGLRDREREVGDAVAADVLDDHVDDDVRVGQAAEHLRGGARLVEDVADDDLGLVLVGGDAADDDLFHVGDFFFHEGSWIVVERGADFKDDAVLLGELDRADCITLDPAEASSSISSYEISGSLRAVLTTRGSAV
jgi:hypothetical protein